MSTRRSRSSTTITRSRPPTRRSRPAPGSARWFDVELRARAAAQAAAMRGSVLLCMALADRSRGDLRFTMTRIAATVLCSDEDQARIEALVAVRTTKPPPAPQVNVKAGPQGYGRA